MGPAGQFVKSVRRILKGYAGKFRNSKFENRISSHFYTKGEARSTYNECPAILGSGPVEEEWAEYW